MKKLITFIFISTLLNAETDIKAYKNGQPVYDYFYSLYPQETKHLTNADYATAENITLQNVLNSDKGERSLLFINFSVLAYEKALQNNYNDVQFEKLNTDLRVLHGKLMESPAHKVLNTFSDEQLHFIGLDTKQKNIQLLFSVAKDFQIPGMNTLSKGTDLVIEQMKEMSQRKIDEKNILRTQDDAFINMLNSGKVIRKAYDTGIKTEHYRMLFQKTAQNDVKCNLWTSSQTNLSMNPNIASQEQIKKIYAMLKNNPSGKEVLPLNKEQLLASYNEAQSPVLKAIESSQGAFQQLSLNKKIVFPEADYKRIQHELNSARSSIITLSNLSKLGGDLETARSIYIGGTSIIDFATAVVNYQKTMSDIGLGIATTTASFATLNLVSGIASALFNLFSIITGSFQQDPTREILKGLKHISKQIEIMHVHMKIHFDLIDKKIDTVFNYMQQGFQLVLNTTFDIKQDTSLIKQTVLRIEEKADQIDKILFLYFRDISHQIYKKALSNCELLEKTQSSRDLELCLTDIRLLGLDMASNASMTGDYRMASVREKQSPTDFYMNIFPQLEKGLWSQINTVRESSILRWDNKFLGGIEDKLVNPEFVNNVVETLTNTTIRNIHLIKRNFKTFEQTITGIRSSLYNLKEKLPALTNNYTTIKSDYVNAVAQLKFFISRQKKLFLEQNKLVGYKIEEDFLSQEPANSKTEMDSIVYVGDSDSLDEEKLKEAQKKVVATYGPYSLPRKVNINLSKIIPKDLILAHQLGAGRLEFQFLPLSWIWREDHKINEEVTELSAHLNIPIQLVYKTVINGKSKQYPVIAFDIISKKRNKYGRDNFKTEYEWNLRGHGKTERSYVKGKLLNREFANTNDNFEPPAGFQNWKHIAFKEMVDEWDYYVTQLEEGKYINSAVKKTSSELLLQIVKPQVQQFQLDAQQKLRNDLINKLQNDYLKELAMTSSGAKKMLSAIMYYTKPVSFTLNSDLRSLFLGKFSLIDQEVLIDYLLMGCPIDEESSNLSKNELCKKIYSKNEEKLAQLDTLFEKLKNSNEQHPIIEHALTKLEILNQISSSYMPKTRIEDAIFNLRRTVEKYVIRN